MVVIITFFMIGGFSYIICLRLVFDNSVFTCIHQKEVGIDRCLMFGDYRIGANIYIQEILTRKYIPKKAFALGIAAPEYFGKYFIENPVPTGFFQFFDGSVLPAIIIFLHVGELLAGQAGAGEQEYFVVNVCLFHII